MRSRYTAYTVGDFNYLRSTWHPATCPKNIEEGDAPKCLGLRVLACGSGSESDDSGTVEFEARYKVNGKAFRLHEKSEFTRISGRWYYIGGIVT